MLKSESQAKKERSEKFRTGQTSSGESNHFISSVRVIKKSHTRKSAIRFGTESLGTLKDEK